MPDTGARARCLERSSARCANEISRRGRACERRARRSPSRAHGSPSVPAHRAAPRRTSRRRHHVGVPLGYGSFHPISFLRARRRASLIRGVESPARGAGYRRLESPALAPRDLVAHNTCVSRAAGPCAGRPRVGSAQLLSRRLVASQRKAERVAGAGVSGGRACGAPQRWPKGYLAPPFAVAISHAIRVPPSPARLRQGCARKVERSPGRRPTPQRSSGDPHAALEHGVRGRGRRGAGEAARRREARAGGRLRAETAR